MAKLTGTQARELLTREGMTTLNGADILNAIWNEATPQYQAIVPQATNSNIIEVGRALDKLQTLQNEFIAALVDRISLVVIKKKMMRNPLAKFKRGDLLNGAIIEEIFVDLVQAKEYNPEIAESEVFKRVVPDTKVYFHQQPRKQFYKQTIQDSSLQQAFTDYRSFDNFLASVINAVYNSAEVDEYRLMLELVNKAVRDEDMKVVEVKQTGTDKKADAYELLEMMRTVFTRITLPMGSRFFNKAGVHTTTDESDVHVLMLPETQSMVDVNGLASAFNMDKATFLGNRTLVDGFADPNVLAVILDKNWFMVFDKLQKMESIRNSDGLYWNYSYHVWQILSYSLLENAVVIKKGNGVKAIIDPKFVDVAKGATKQFTGEVIGATASAQSWTVTGGIAGTTINTSGLLTVASGETATSLTVTFKATVDGKDYTDDAHVTVKSA